MEARNHKQNGSKISEKTISIICDTIFSQIVLAFAPQYQELTTP